ncbi:efflux RND transporter permease subunit [Planococcus lenghuensis]|uniref:RND transporter n=1 Tax=Planococcus lenghuensis TaxID=2213202 RepID=A0A1Q2L3J3_9BACL|nr:MMPL family transporter [Planococcus lenghuensis]AQQ54983.1 RND transporter [Planococcus lenghuensis]
MKDYLPEEAQSTEALAIMQREFGGSVPTNRIMMNELTIQEALAFKEQLAAVDGVSDVTWLDDAVDLSEPLEMANADTVDNYYKDGLALFTFSIQEGEEVVVTDRLYELIGEDNALAGEALDTATQQKMAGTESMYAAALLVPIIILILVLSTTSWIEPALFLTAIGVSVLINMGTNIFFGEVSFVTQSVAPILQLAVSLDYAIFLLHSFSDYRKKTVDPEEAMQLAMNKSFPAITASASTTFFGFIALSFMDFEIGADLGITLVKGIFLSFVSVMVFLPALTLLVYKWIDKTQHRPLLPTIPNKGRVLTKLRVPVLILVALIVVPAFLAQSQTSFIYGIGDQPENTRAGSDIAEIREHFGKSTPLVVLVPRGDVASEEALVQELSTLPAVSDVVSYVSTVGAAIPPEAVGEDVTEQFYSDNYSRLILQTNTETEGEEAFGLIEEVHELAGDFYGNDAYLLGESVTLYDIRNTVQDDNTFVNMLTLVTISFVLLITFRSITIPLILLLTIQTSVWINLSVPYFTDASLVYVGYLLVSIIQLAATVDYAILLTDTYKEYRQEMPALAAMKRTLDEKIFSIGISAAILSSVGFILWITSTNPIVSSIGLLLGRGALLAFVMVVLLLPALFIVFDKVVEKTTWKANFYKKKEN